MDEVNQKITIKSSIGLAGKEIFKTFLVGFIILLCLEIWKKGFVTYFFDLKILLVIIVVSGITSVLFEPKIIPRTMKKIANRAQTIRKNIKHRSIDGIK